MLVKRPRGRYQGTARKETAGSLLKHLNATVGQCNADCDSLLHTGVQHESSSGPVFSHQRVYIDSVPPIDANMLTGKGEDDLCL